MQRVTSITRSGVVTATYKLCTFQPNPLSDCHLNVLQRYEFSSFRRAASLPTGARTSSSTLC